MQYAGCLQNLLMGELYSRCEPISHSWPGRKHIEGIVEAVHYLTSQLDDLRRNVRG